MKVGPTGIIYYSFGVKHIIIELNAKSSSMRRVFLYYNFEMTNGKKKYYTDLCSYDPFLFLFHMHDNSHLRQFCASSILAAHLSN